MTHEDSSSRSRPKICFAADTSCAYVRDCTCVFLFPYKAAHPSAYAGDHGNLSLGCCLAGSSASWVAGSSLSLPPSLPLSRNPTLFCCYTRNDRPNAGQQTQPYPNGRLHCIALSVHLEANLPEPTPPRYRLLGVPIPGFFTQLSFGQRFLRAFPLPITTLGLAERQKTAIQKRTPLGPVSRRQRHSVTLGALQDFTPPPFFCKGAKQSSYLSSSPRQQTFCTGLRERLP